MRHFIATLLGFLLAVPASFAASGNVVAAANVHAHLESEVSRVGPGQSFWVALVLDIGDGWHTYWRNPGDSGQATTLDWTLPAGFRAGPIEWPAPHRFVLAPLVNFGYAGQAVHLVRITAPAALRPGAPITLRAQAHWLVCSNICIPENAALELTLPASAMSGAIDPGAAPLFAGARALLPQRPPAPATAAIGDGHLRITLGPAWGASLSDVASLSFVPYDDGVIAYAAPQSMSRGGGIDLTMKLGDEPPKGGAIGGILFVTTAGHGAAPLTIPLAIQATVTTASAATPTAATTPTTSAGTATAAAAQPPHGAAPALGALLALALLGGMVLNLMPCVLPVLSIKALGFVQQARHHPHEVRMKGLAFAAGVVVSMLALAAALLLLRAGGEQIGWGFQLQSPLFVTLMAYMLLLVGLNLSGAFDIGGGFAGIGEGLTHGDSRRASFFTGVLTTLVATPCTAPFMAAAVGAALTQSAVVALAIFGTLGLGLALPILLLSYAPWLQRLLPKPGAWMETLKQVFAFPMYASAAWLLWVLAQQTSAIGLGAALAGLVLIAMAAWAYQKIKTSRGRAGRVAAAATAAVSLIAAVWLPANLEGAPRSDAASAAVNDAGWQPYDPARVAKLRAAGRPILIDFTASWCLTCLVNERNTFSEPAVRAVFRDKDVALFKGDWTRQDPRITRALAHFGRAGVPLYVVYNGVPGSTGAVVLPQVLTASIVEGAFAALPGRMAH